MSIDFQSEHVYIVFSSTGTRIGAMIRFVTGNKYNHVSVALDGNLKKMYSFTRYHSNAPFVAGFSEESPLRYCGDPTEVKVCRIPVSAESFAAISSYINELQQHSSRYIYNFFSAALFPAKRKVRIRDAFTCLEFGVHILSRFQVVNGISDRKFYSFPDLERLLTAYIVYEGVFSGIALPEGWGNDFYPLCVKGKIKICAGSAKQVCRLLFRLVRV